MRARSLKPGLFKNEILGCADPLLTLLFEGLWGMADRDGRLEDIPLRICAELFPYRRQVTEKKADHMLTWLHDQNFITRYEINSRGFIQILEFAKHQRPHFNEAPSTIQALTSPGALPRSKAAANVKTPPLATKVASHFALTPDSGLRTPDSGLLTPDSGRPPLAAQSTPGDDAWQQVGGCDQEAMQAWIDHRQVVKPPGLRGHERIAAAKMLKGIGSPQAQRAAVQNAVANGWSNLRITDGQPSRINGRVPEPTRADREAAEAAELIALADSRAARGLLDFRDPYPNETPGVYATQLRNAEHERRGRPKGAAAATIGDLAASKRMPK